MENKKFKIGKNKDIGVTVMVDTLYSGKKQFTVTSDKPLDTTLDIQDLSSLQAFGEKIVELVSETKIFVQDLVLFKYLLVEV